MLHQVEDISIIGPAGELDPFEGKLLLEKIANLVRHEWSKIILDLREVSHIHFQFLSDLLAASSLLSGEIKLANLNSYTKEILRLAGADRYFETYDSVAEAILSFQNHLTQPCAMQ